MTNFFNKKYIWTIIYSIILVSFTVYVFLDTFIICKIYDTSINNVDTSPKIEAIITDTSYKDENIEIQLTEYNEYDTTIYVADIKLSSAEYLKAAFAKNAYGQNVKEKTSDMAKNNNAILAINGDYYGVRQKGYVIRNNTIYRDSYLHNKEDLVIYSNGNFEIFREQNFTAEELLNNNAMHVFSFGPALIDNSKLSVGKNSEVSKAKSKNPRTAIGIIDELHYVFVVSDGRTKESKGLSLYQLANFMQTLGVTTAYNLDGGGSSAMYFNDKLINKPTTTGETINERKVSDIVYIGY